MLFFNSEVKMCLLDKLIISVLVVIGGIVVLVIKLGVLLFFMVFFLVFWFGFKDDEVELIK